MRIALEAVLQDTWACEADSLVCLGDIVGYGAQPRECTELFRRLNCACLLGNHDFYTISDTYDEVLDDPRSEHNPVWAGIRHARDELSDEDLAWLDKLPTLSTIEGGIIAHAALHDFDEWPYLRTAEEARPTLKLLSGRVGFFGHTHRQNIFKLPVDTSFAITVGSVGQPRDSGPDATWTLWDSEARTVSFRQVAYDFTSAAHTILEAGLPSGSALRLLA